MTPSLSSARKTMVFHLGLHVATSKPLQEVCKTFIPPIPPWLTPSQFSSRMTQLTGEAMCCQKPISTSRFRDTPTADNSNCLVGHPLHIVTQNGREPIPKVHKLSVCPTASAPSSSRSASVHGLRSTSSRSERIREMLDFTLQIQLIIHLRS